jgi:sterol desaturase/sphingolipid hydroxylase (fatty acid hydroxylase superfamily)
MFNRMERAYITTKNESVRMFESEFMEFCSHVHPIVPLVIYLPFIAWLLFVAFWQKQLSTVAVVALFAVGMVMWTLFEYLMHRYVFHYQPKSAWGKRLHFIIHGVHHDYPNDASRLVMPPAVSIPIAVAMYFVFSLAFARFAPALSAGFAFGYVCYDSIHYATHHISAKRGPLFWLKQYHLRHHYKDDHFGYGVSSPVWDFILGTKNR